MKHLGYYDLEVEEGLTKRLSFSMNFIINLQEITGKDFSTWGKEMDSKDHLEKGKAICDLVYAAMWAHEQEEGTDANYNIYKVRKWVGGLSEESKKGLVEALEHNCVPVSSGN